MVVVGKHAGGGRSAFHVADGSAVLAKISRPILPEVLLRPRLLRTLEPSPAARIIWIAGLPGSGKTTLAASYVEARKRRCLWYQIDEGDADPASFFYNLRLAAQAASPRQVISLPLLTPEHRVALPTFVRNVFRELFRQLEPSSLLLVFDGWDALPGDASLHVVMAQAFAEVPMGGQVIVSSRTDPSPPFARLRANGAMHVLGGDEMRFTLRESLALARLWGRRSRREVVAAHERMRGWAAGLVLSLAGKREPFDAPSNDGSPSAVFDYFAGEIFGRLDADTRTFLVETAILPRTTAKMAERVTGMSSAEERLEKLVQDRYFTTRSSEPDPFYAYHPLFREFLLGRESTLLTPSRRAQVRRTAATVLGEAGLVEDALHLLEEATAWDEMAALLLEHAPALARSGRGDTMGAWLQKIPTAQLEQNPWLSYWLGVALMFRDVAAARNWLARGYERFIEEDDAAGLYLTWAQIIESYFVEWGDFAGLDRWIDVLETLRGRHPVFPSPEIEARVTWAVVIALQYRRPDAARMAEWSNRLFAMAIAAEAPDFKVVAGTATLAHATWMGHSERVHALIEALASSVKRVPHVPSVQLYWSCTAQWSVHAGSPNEAIVAAEAGFALASETGIHVFDYILRGQLAFAFMLLHRYRDAAREIDRLGTEIDPSLPLHCSFHDFMRASLALCTDEGAIALDHATSSVAWSEREGVPFPRAFAVVTCGLAALAVGDLGSAEAHLADARAFAVHVGSDLIEFNATVGLARLALRRGDEAATKGLLRRALFLARRRGFWFPGLWYSPGAASELCTFALENDMEPEWIARVIRRAGLWPPADRVPPERWPWPVRIRTLGRFAIERDCAAGEAVARARKVQRRPLSLLKLLVVLGPRGAPTGRIADLLWPDEEGDAAQHALEMAVHRLRKMFGSERAIHVREGHIALDGAFCWVDAWAFEAQAAAALAEADGRGPGPRAQLLQKALASYGGTFLAEDDQPWAVDYRARLERLRRKLEPPLAPSA